MFSKQLIGLTVASVQSGLPCGKIESLIVSPEKLTVELLCILDQGGIAYLLPSDIRFIADDRVIIDAEHKLSEADDLLRHQEAIKNAFSPIGCSVVTESRKKLGKVSEYSLDNQSWAAVKLYVSPGLFGNPLQEELMVDRHDVVDVMSNKIVIRDLHGKAGSRLTIPLPETPR